MQTVPLFGAGVFGKSAVVTRQRRLNCYYENRPDGDKAKVVIYGTPGLIINFTNPTVAQAIRGILSTNETNLYTVAGNLFQQITPPNNSLGIGGAASVSASATLGSSGSSPVSMCSNPGATQVLVVDGSSGYVWNGTAFVACGAWFVPGSQTCTNVAGYFVTEQAGTPNFNVSNINDATTGSGLSYAAASAFPEIIQAVDNLNGNLILFSQQHMEFWQNAQTPPPSQPFVVISAATNQWGLAATFSRAHVDNALLFLGETTTGVRRVCRLDGYTVTPISEEIDWIINQPGFVYSDAEALVYQRDKHPFYQITFPTMGRSFLFDLSTGISSEVQTGVSAPPIRHQARWSSYWNGQLLLTDYQNSNVYQMSDTQFTDNGVTIQRQVVTKHTVKGFNRFRVPLLYLDMETGVGLQSGQGKTPQIMLECSKDNGRTWLGPRLINLGAIGQYVTRVVARRFGMSRVFTWRITMTDPVKFVITDGAIMVKEKRGGTF
jgi:hypothetical protein